MHFIYFVSYYNICWHILEAVQQKPSDASLRIKREGRHRTLSLTYSTSAKNNIEHGCTAPTSIPLVLFSSMHRNLSDVQYNPLETQDCLVTCTLVVTVIEDAGLSGV